MIQKIYKGDTNENFRIGFPKKREIKKQIKSIRVISRKAIPDFQKDNPNPKGKRRQVQKGNVM